MSELGDDLKGEGRAAVRTVVAAGIGAAVTALVAWIRTRPVKRAVERRRARRAAAAASDQLPEELTQRVGDQKHQHDA